MPEALYALKYVPPRSDFIATMTDREAEAIQAHFLYLKSLYEAGRVTFVGRCENGKFGLAFVKAPDQASAEAVRAADPAVQAGVFKAEIDEFKIIFS